MPFLNSVIASKNNFVKLPTAKIKKERQEKSKNLAELLSLAEQFYRIQVHFDRPLVNKTSRKSFLPSRRKPIYSSHEISFLALITSLRDHEKYDLRVDEHFNPCNDYKPARYLPSNNPSSIS